MESRPDILRESEVEKWDMYMDLLYMGRSGICTWICCIWVGGRVKRSLWLVSS
jgi:hypothetical protein